MLYYRRIIFSWLKGRAVGVQITLLDMKTEEDPYLEASKNWRLLPNKSQVAQVEGPVTNYHHKSHARANPPFHWRTELLKIRTISRALTRRVSLLAMNE